jgi:cytochrome c-type biogenesis protein CcmH/NrfG
VNQGTRPTPDPDPERLSIESLERQLRALPPSEVPGTLSSKLIATIPPAKVAGATAAGVTKYWLWIAGISLVCIATGAVLISRQTFWNPKSPSETNENPGAAASSTTSKDTPATSKAIQQFESAIRLDPYNADAWFSLAKAQADVHRAEDAVSSAQKALDIARSRNRSDLVGAIETWLRSRRRTKSDQPDR